MNASEKHILGIYFSPPGTLDYPLSEKIYQEAFSEIIEKLAEEGIETVIVRADSYEGTHRFARYDVWNGSTYERVEEPIEIDLLWNRDSENTIPPLDCPVINLQEFDSLCRDKWESYVLLKDYSPLTFLLQSFEDFEKHIDALQSERIVLKPRYGESAVGVHVLTPQEVQEALYDSWTDIVLQECIDSDSGCPGLTDGRHEINVNVVNGHLAGGRLKVFDNDTYVAAAFGSKGITLQGLTNETMPDSIRAFLEEIDQKLLQWSPRLYRLDFMHTESGFQVVEINSRPGVMHREKEGDHYWEFNGRIVEMIVGEMRRM